MARGLLTWVVILKLGQVIDILVDNDPEGVGLVMRRNVACAEGLGHGGRHCLLQKRLSVDHENF